jgi:signal recognition particle subunit SRP54
MLESLSASLQKVIKKVRGHGRMTEENIAEAVRDVRMALLEADVSFEVVKDFVASLRERCLGQEVTQSITPGQQFVKCVHEELVALLGEKNQAVDLNGHPASVLLLGLHGSGKTTSCAKLALHWKGKGKRVVMVAADIRRPAAVEQLAVLGEQIDVEVIRPTAGEVVPALGARGLDEASRSGADVVLFDTGGRFQVDEELVQELEALRDAVTPRNTILVVDSALGQESVNVARTFHERIGLTGLVLTKLDGDARGGAALSIRRVAGCPVLFSGVGEKLEDLEPFYPDRLASRILGMGDVVSLVEKVQEVVDEDQAQRMEQTLRKKRLNLEDFLEQLRQIRKMGSMDSIMKMLPISADLKASAGTGPDAAAQMDSFAVKAEAIILSMTPTERRRPALLNGSRRKRIAGGSGTTPSDVNELMRRFQQAQKMAKKMGKMQKAMQKGLNVMR